MLRVRAVSGYMNGDPLGLERGHDPRRTATPVVPRHNRLFDAQRIHVLVRIALSRHGRDLIRHSIPPRLIARFVEVAVHMGVLQSLQAAAKAKTFGGVVADPVLMRQPQLHRAGLLHLRHPNAAKSSPICASTALAQSDGSSHQLPGVWPARRIRRLPVMGWLTVSEAPQRPQTATLDDAH